MSNEKVSTAFEIAKYLREKEGLRIAGVELRWEREQAIAPSLVERMNVPENATKLIDDFCIRWLGARHQGQTTITPSHVILQTESPEGNKKPD